MRQPCAKILYKDKCPTTIPEMGVHHKLMVMETAIIQTILDVDIVCSAWQHAAELKARLWKLRSKVNIRNLQNIPSHSAFAKIIKECFVSPDNWVFVGADYASLEDKINTLLTRDPNKEKVYTDGFDGHSLRALSYFRDQITGIDEHSVDSVNSIAKLYPDQRQASKAPTFALTYGGTFITLMNNCGFTEEQAKTIEARYHELYAVADQWTANLIEQAKTIGYIPLAFGGRIRTPLLAMSKGKKLSYQAQKEARSAGNAATQSYCVLTLRAINEFMERVWASPYKYQILPSATIHDAGYFMVYDSANAVHWVNENLIDCMAWQQLPEIQHPIIKITSSLEIYWPSWNQQIKIPNGATKTQIKQLCEEAERKINSAN